MSSDNVFSLFLCRLMGKGSGEVIIEKGKGPPIWFKLYVILGSFAGWFTFLGMGYIYTYGIANVCADAREFMSDEWILENCPNPPIANSNFFFR